MNIKNNFQLIGRLTQDPAVFDNKDGSKKVRLTLAAKDNFTSKDGERGSQFVPVEDFISADRVNKSGIGIYASMHKGDLVAVTGQIQNNNYTDSKGEKRYELVLRIETRDMLEPKSVTDARQINKAVAADNAGAVAEDTAVE